MDRTSFQLCSSFFIKAIFLACLSYLFYIEHANAAINYTTLLSQNDPFYKPTLYRENYILPYHRLRKKIKPRPTTLNRTVPTFEEKMRRQRERSINESDSDEGSIRTISESHKDPSKRHARLISDADASSIHYTPTPISPVQTKDSLLQRTRTVMGRMKSENKALQALEGKLEAAETATGRQAIQKEINHKMTYVVEESFKDLLDLMRFKFIKKSEVAFQISLKIPILRVVNTDTRIYAAYTQRSWWQCYTKVSAFFRESNYMPEFFIEQPVAYRLFKSIFVENIKLGGIHQSNGAGIFLERSWNRAFLEICLRWQYFRLNLEGWWVLPTKDLSTYNPNIMEDLGYGQATLQFQSRLMQCMLVLQKSNYQVLGSVPISPSLNFTFYHFNGKGSTLGLQDQYNRSWGIGIGAR